MRCKCLVGAVVIGIAIFACGPERQSQEPPNVAKQTPAGSSGEWERRVQQRTIDEAAAPLNTTGPIPVKTWLVVMKRFNIPAGRDFRQEKVRGADLSGQDLSCGIFEGCDLRQTNFTGSNLSYAYFGGADLDGADFSDVILNHTYLRGCNYWATTGTPAEVTRVFVDPEEAQASAEPVRIGRVSDAMAAELKALAETTTESLMPIPLDEWLTKLKEFGIPVGRDFRTVKVAEKGFAGADLQGAIFAECDLSGVSFRGSNLAYAYFGGANLEGVDFTGVILHYTYLRGSNYWGAKGKPKKRTPIFLNAEHSRFESWRKVPPERKVEWW